MGLENIINSAAEKASAAVDTVGDAFVEGTRAALGEENFHELQYKLGSINDGIAFVKEAEPGDDTAGTAMDVIDQTNDRALMEDYLNRMGEEPSEEIQLRINEVAQHLHGRELHATSSFQDRQRDAATFEYVNNLPAAQAANLKRYEEGLEKGYYQDLIPEYMAGMPNDVLRQIAKDNPKAFAETFPGSFYTQEPELGNLVERAVKELKYFKAKELSNSLCGVPKGSNLLDNQNISGEQLYQLAKAATETQYNPTNPQAFANMSRIVKDLITHPHAGPQAKTLLRERFPEGSLGKNAWGELNA